MPGEPAVGREFRRPGPVIEKPRHEKEPGRREPEVDHLEQAALESLEIQGEQPQHDKPQVADAGVREQAAEIRLDERDQRAVNDRDQTQSGHQPEPVFGRLREQRDREPDEAERAQLHAGQEHAHHDRPLDQRGWQPGVERKDRRLEGEPEEHQEEDQRLLLGRHRHVQEIDKIEGVEGLRVGRHRRGMVVQIEQHHPDQHQHRPGQRVEDVLQRGVLAVRPRAPELDQEVARHQHQLPEEEEQDEVQRREDAHDGAFQAEQRHQVGLEQIPLGVPGIDHDQKDQKRRQGDEEDVDAVHAHVVADPDGRDPLGPLRELDLGAVRREVPHQQDGDEELQPGHRQGGFPDEVLVLLEQPERDRADDRQEGQDREDRKADLLDGGDFVQNHDAPPNHRNSAIRLTSTTRPATRIAA